MNYFNSPALDVSVAFPQATPASTFPPCTSDYYQIDDLLTLEEQAIRLRVRECMEKDVAPIMAEYWEKAEFPFQIIPKLGALRIAGGTIKGYGCPGLSIMANAFATAEIARVDASCSAFFLVLAVSRVMVAWQPIGLCMGVYDMCHRYLKERKQFGAPLAAFQINQEKLVRMLGNVQAMVALGKSWITLRARETVALGREILGGNGILSDFLVAKAFGDLEPIYTFEGTYDINALVAGRKVTGIASFRPAASTQRSRL